LTLSRLRAFFRQRVRYRVTLAGFLFLLAPGLTGAASFVSGFLSRLVPRPGSVRFRYNWA